MRIDQCTKRSNFEIGRVTERLKASMSSHFCPGPYDLFILRHQFHIERPARPAETVSVEHALALGISHVGNTVLN